MKMYGIGFLIYFFEALEKFFAFFKNLVFLKNYSVDFLKKKSGTNGKSAHSSVCTHTPRTSFYLTPILYSLRKSVRGEFLTHNFGFLYFSQNLLSQIGDFGFNA